MEGLERSVGLYIKLEEMNNSKAGIAGILILFAIILGAFSAHAFKEILSAEKLTSFETGIRYQMYEGLALLILALNWDKFQFSMKWIWGLQLVGVLLFSVSIYLLAFQEFWGVKLSFLGPITPLGGSLMIIGWLIFVINLLLPKKQ